MVRRPPQPPGGWLSDGTQVLRFRPVTVQHSFYVLEPTEGERLPGEAIPLLKRRQELSREKALEV